MKLAVARAQSSELVPWRERYRREMNCQIVHDTLHARPGWTESYLINGDGHSIGYVALAVGGPWRETRTLFEFFVAPEHRPRASHIFAAATADTHATALLWQTNDASLHAHAQVAAIAPRTSKIVFEDHLATARACPGAQLRRVMPADRPRIFPHTVEPVGEWLLELEGAIAATGGFLTHYNPPFADLYLEVAPEFRRRGLGAFLLQELKRESRRAGHVPCARCSPENVASLHTCAAAGLRQVASILEADLSLAAR